MKKFQFIPVLAIAFEMCFASLLNAQNPPMNCTPDGIIEVCTLADTSSPPPAAEAAAPAPPAPSVPHVTYTDGQLTITADNIPLNDVLHEVSVKTGAAIEVPNGSAAEPVFANLGPGSVRDVLVALLNGTKFNYVMLGSSNASSSLEKIVLTPSDQTAEVAESSAPAIPPHVAAPAPSNAGLSPEEKKAAFLAQVENLKQMRMQELQQKYADLASKGLLRTRDSGSADSTSPAATDSAASNPPAPSDSSSQ